MSGQAVGCGQNVGRISGRLGWGNGLFCRSCVYFVRVLLLFLKYSILLLRFESELE